MYNNIFDSHAHYDDERFNDDLSYVLDNLPKSGISYIINCATDINSCVKCKTISDTYNYIYFAAGIHPHEAEHIDENYIEHLKKFTKTSKCVAIGEIGLDYHYDFSPREIQKKVFEEQIILANEVKLPIIVHDREAHFDTLNLLKKHKPKGVVHCFSGSKESAKEIINLGLYIGLGGAVTFKNAKTPLEVAEYVPLDKLLLETDCPYMAPVPYRGKRNDSSLIPYIAKVIADIKKISVQELLDITNENAIKFFGINE